ncbi:MAG TPA: LamG-like jellyroll fold domain-containing protein [Acidobacteriaceae bacterium]|jgi:hypothetical protein
MKKLVAALVLLAVSGAVPGRALAQTAASLHWSFSRGEGATPVDSVRGAKASLAGEFAYVPGVSGDALRLDGYTTSMTVPAGELPAMSQGFTVGAWVALNTYPWNWAPIFDQQSQRQAGFYFGIDPFGHVGLQASINGQWRSAISTGTLPLKRWIHLAGTYRTSGGHGFLAIYMNGSKVAELPVEGELSPSNVDLLIGRVRQATLPFPEAEVKPPHPVWYSLDGLLDELTIFGSGRTDTEVAQDASALKTPAGDVLPWQKMPSGPSGEGRFGAYYATLKYEEPWDRLRQIGPDGDVVVRFDESPSRLVFWQGLNYIPAWVTGDDKWYTDEFLEVWDHGCPDNGDCEPMSDKLGRFTHVEILESNDVRAVVHWRYALVEAVGYKPAWHDPLTGRSDWADEYWTVYPDGVAIRKQVLHSANIHGIHEWQETIVLHQPGSTPEDDINPDAITLANMQGETKTFTWRANTPGAFANPLGPLDLSTPPGANIQRVNLKSNWKPFQIVPPEGVSSDFYNNEKSYFRFECWNHWPVAQIESSDRPCVTDDRPSHSSLSHLFWKTYSEGEGTATKILMDGLTTQSITNLLPLAKSWLSPPPLQVNGSANAEYDPAQRAYVLSAASANGMPLRLHIDASPASPLFHAAILIRNWPGRFPEMLVEGKAVQWDKQHRAAVIHRLDGADLLVWIEQQSTKPIDFTLNPGKGKPPRQR